MIEGGEISAADGIVAKKTVAIEPGAVLPEQIAGDAFIVQFKRGADAPDDTCNGSVFIHAIDVRYPI